MKPFNDISSVITEMQNALAAQAVSLLFWKRKRRVQTRPE